MSLKLKKYLAISFFVLAGILLWLLSNPPVQREGVDDTLVRLDKIDTKTAQQDKDIKALEKKFEESKSRISEGEKQVNSQIGNMQLAI
jgi:hypothetical protein